MGFAVDADQPPGSGGLIRLKGKSGAELDRTQPAVHARPHGPGFAAGARQLGIGGAPQTLTGRQQRQSFEQVGLTRAIGAAQHDGHRANLERDLAVIAEVGEL